jgi:hypothetical protein
MFYAYIPAKRSGKVHELDESGRTYCQAENSTARLVLVESFPPQRQACWCCKQVKAQRLYEATHGKLDAEFRAVLQ